MISRAPFLILAVGSLTACIQTRVGEIPISARAVVLDPPVINQEEAGLCGLVALSVLCKYHGVTVPAGTASWLAHRARSKDGLSGAELRGVLQGLDMSVMVFSGTLGHAPRGLYGHIDARRPVLTMISPDGETNHYCLVTGYDPETDAIHLFDPERGRIALSTERFDAMWDPTQRFALVAAPHSAFDAGDPGALHAREGLEELRAGDLNLSDRDLKVIGITVLAVLLLVLIF